MANCDIFLVLIGCHNTPHLDSKTVSKEVLPSHLESQLCLNSTSKKYFIKITTTLEKNLLASIVPMQITLSIGEISEPVDYAILFVNTYSLDNVVHPSNNRALAY